MDLPEEWIKRVEDSLARNDEAHQQIFDELTHHSGMLDRVADKLDGPCVENVDGDKYRDHEQSMERRIERHIESNVSTRLGKLEDRLANGGIRVRFSPAQWLTLVTAVVAAGATVIVAIIQTH